MAPQCVTLTDSTTGATANILAGFGFNCYRFQVVRDSQQVDVLWSADGFQSGNERPSGSGIPILFPFPGRIQGTTLQWQGKQYSLPEGDGQGNAIHGFVHERAWRVIEQSASHVVGQFQASVDDPTLLECWPADFRITATYRLEGDALTGEYQVENPDQQPLPCGLGTHPYFCVPLGGERAEDCRVKLPVSFGWELEGMIVTGKQTPLDNAPAFREGLAFGEMAMDNVFGGLEFADDICTTSIHDPASNITVVQTFDRSFSQCVVYNPPHREALCIEPYSCLPDPFRLSRQGIDAGLRVLAAGETWETQVTIRVE